MAVAAHLVQSVGLAPPGCGAVAWPTETAGPEHRGWVLTHGLVGEGHALVVQARICCPTASSALAGSTQGGDGGLDLVAADGLQQRLAS